MAKTTAKQRRRARRAIRNRKPLKPVKRKVQTKAATPAQEATFAPPTTPFASGDMLMDRAEQEGSWTEELAGLGENEAAATAALPAALDSIAQIASRSRANADANAAERGVFASSIRDMAITDVNAQEAINKSNAEGLVQAAHRAYGARKQQIEGPGGERQRFYGGYNQKAIENARGVDQERGPLTEATPASAAQFKTVKDFAPGTPGIQSHAQAVAIRRKRAGVRPRAQTPGQPVQPGGGRGSQRGRPRRPGGPRKPRAGAYGRL